ncbi:MAG: anaerobic ribonucleoside-triphosphate reductase activating protein [Lachnospiraceae bacterium]|nr:anaerobic ribonucleoside-triphosphate reductase activating protein [Lachnospiraceae bacterium]
MKIFGLQKTTLLDYPGRIASIIFTGGCNMKCPYCHNSELITGIGGEEISEEEVFKHLKKRGHTLEGLVITGGECTLQKDLFEFCKKVRDLGFDIKLDTNGTSSKTLISLVENDLIQYVAVDIKNCKEKYPATVGFLDYNIKEIEECVSYLLEDHLPYEFRTTVVSEFHTEDDFHKMGEWIQGAKAYYIQPFKDGETVLKKGLHTPSKEQLLRYRDIMSTYVTKAEIRGLDL